MKQRNPVKPFKPGDNRYSDYLKTLTKKQLKEHFINKKLNYNANQALRSVVNFNQEKWISLVLNSALDLLSNSPSANELNQISDRLFGKPIEKVESKVESNITIEWFDESTK